MFVHDFIPLERDFGEMSDRVVARGGSLVVRAITAGHPDAHCVVEAGDIRRRDDVVVLPLRLHTDDHGAPFTVLEADLQLAPLAPGWTHLSLSGTFGRRGHDVDTHVERLVDQRRTEAYVRMVLLDVAGELEGAPAAAAAAHT